jgi:hypothetical protein
MSMPGPLNADRKDYRPVHRKSRLAGFALAAAAFTAVTGCGHDPSLARWDAFAAAAARAAGRAPPGPAERPLPYPGVQQRTVPEAEVKVGVPDFFSLGRCGVRQQLAERNSILGRLQDAARRLAYEHALILRLEDCLVDLAASGTDEDEALAKLVSGAVIRLRERLPALRWNAGFGSDELAASFGPGAGPLPAGAGTARSQASALETVAGALADLGVHGRGIDRETLVAAQERLEKGRFGARLHRAIAVATHRLDHAAASVSALAADGCPAEPVAVVAASAEGNELDRWLDELQAQGQAWFRALEALNRSSPLPPEGFLRWWEAEADPHNRGGRWQRFLDARRRLEDAMSRCPAPDGPG